MGIRVGIGYDAHRLAPRRELILGGVRVPFERGLLGHSDADVLVHALIDSILGAMAIGDIGKFFPDTDAKYEGVSSITLLGEIREIMSKNNYELINADTVVVAQEPKLAPYIDLMRQNISNALKTDIGNISVKAKTEEGLGFTGDGSGIKAKSVCLLEMK